MFISSKTEHQNMFYQPKSVSQILDHFIYLGFALKKSSTADLISNKHFVIAESSNGDSVDKHIKEGNLENAFDVLRTGAPHLKSTLWSHIKR